MKPVVMKTETFNLLVCDPVTAAVMRRLQQVEARNKALRSATVGDLRTIRRDVRAIRRQTTARASA